MPGRTSTASWQLSRLELWIVDLKPVRRQKLLPVYQLVSKVNVFNTKDMPTEMGSPIWKDFTPGNDARVVHYLRMAQAVIPGKTVTAEFAVHAPGPTAQSHNPAKYMPGTSSSGSACAVASYMVPVALGTQTAGSVMRPSSYCGVFGFNLHLV